MELMPGIYQFKLPVPEAPAHFFLNCYLVKGKQGWLLIDPGWNCPEASEVLEKELKSLGLDFSAITQIVVTHLHPDHFGLAKKVRKASGAEIAFHQAEKPFIEHMRSSFSNFDQMMQDGLRWLFRHGIPQEEHESFQMASLGYLKEFLSAPSPQKTLLGGEIISTGLFNFEVVWTRGHSPGHICLYEPERKILFSGDEVLPITTPIIGLYDEAEGNPLADYISSLKALEKLTVNMVFPGHENVFSGLQERIAQLYQHHEARKAAVLDALRECPKTTFEVAIAVPWRGPNGKTLYWQDLTQGDKWMAMMETLAHLQFFILEGTVKRALQEEVCHYSLMK